jgi:hypothetical protein
MQLSILLRRGVEVQTDPLFSLLDSPKKQHHSVRAEISSGDKRNP